MPDKSLSKSGKLGIGLVPKCDNGEVRSQFPFIFCTPPATRDGDLVNPLGHTWPIKKAPIDFEGRE